MWVCSNRRPDGNPKGSCAQQGSEALLNQLKAAMHAAGLTRTVRVMTSGCLDLCEHAAAAVVMPEETFLEKLTEADIPALVEALATAEGARTHPALAGRVIPRETAPAAAPTLVSLGRKPSP